VRALADGRPVQLHDVMIALERGRLAVQTFVQVRNRSSSPTRT
jgi:flagellar hook-basal body complex protein FliE